MKKNLDRKSRVRLPLTWVEGQLGFSMEEAINLQQQPDVNNKTSTLLRPHKWILYTSQQRFTQHILWLAVARTNTLNWTKKCLSSVQRLVAKGSERTYVYVIFLKNTASSFLSPGNGLSVTVILLNLQVSGPYVKDRLMTNFTFYL